jgi:hypothetical protein
VPIATPRWAGSAPRETGRPGVEGGAQQPSARLLSSLGVRNTFDSVHCEPPWQPAQAVGLEQPLAVATSWASRPVRPRGERTVYTSAMSSQSGSHAARAWRVPTPSARWSTR